MTEDVELLTCISGVTRGSPGGSTWSFEIRGYRATCRSRVRKILALLNSYMWNIQHVKLSRKKTLCVVKFKMFPELHKLVNITWKLKLSFLLAFTKSLLNA